MRLHFWPRLKPRLRRELPQAGERHRQRIRTMEEAEVLRLKHASGPGNAALADALSAHLLPALQA